MKDFLTDQSPQGRRRRLLIAVGGGALLALLMLMRRSGGGGQQQTAEDETANAAAGLRGAGVPTTFADNGAAMGAFTTETTEALYGVSNSLDAVTAAQQGLSDSQTDLAGTQASLVSATQGFSDRLDALESAAQQPVVAAPAAIAAAGQATRKKSPAKARKPVRRKAAAKKPARQPAKKRPTRKAAARPRRQQTGRVISRPRNPARTQQALRRAAQRRRK